MNGPGGALIGNLAVGAAVVTSLLVVTGTVVALIGRPSYRLTPEDDAALEGLGLTRSETGVVGGLWGATHVTVDPGQAFVFLRAQGLPTGWWVYTSDAPLAARTQGDVVIHRRTRERLTELDALIKGGSVSLRGGQLELQMPRHAAEVGQLPRLVGLVHDVLEGLGVEPDWRSVALDGEEHTGVRLLGLQRLVHASVPVDELAGALRGDSDPVMGLVSRSLSGDPSGLQAWCDDDAASLALLAVPFLPPAGRGEAVARRLLAGSEGGRSFAQDLLSRLVEGAVSTAELRRLLDVLRAGLERRSPMLGGARFAGLDSVFSVVGPVLGAAAEGDEATEGWVELLMAMLSEAEDDAASTLLDGLAAVATVEHVPALRALEDSVSMFRRGSVADVVRTIQARSSGTRGGLALASTAGGGVGLADTPGAMRPRPRCLEAKPHHTPDAD